MTPHIAKVHLHWKASEYLLADANEVITGLVQLDFLIELVAVENCAFVVTEFFAAYKVVTGLAHLDSLIRLVAVENDAFIVAETFAPTVLVRHHSCGFQ